MISQNGTPSTFAEVAITCLALPRSRRSLRSARVRSVAAGTTIAPSFIAASITSQIATTLGSMTIMRSPRFTPWRRRKFATWLERRDSSAKLNFNSVPSSLTIQSPGFELSRA